MKPLLIALALASAMLAAPCAAQTSEETQQRARENFQQADKNDDRKLNPREFKAFINANAEDDIGRASMVRRFGAYDRAFARLDADKDGEITRAELLAARQQ
ncbi:MAG: EF-hand domain-containing protein [Erythrobacter sp.]|uniref:EF-hand domain-containing protein n=2 Tax=Erythrobacter sp. TaxID=1042 RepID=UPI00329A0A43